MFFFSREVSWFKLHSKADFPNPSYNVKLFSLLGDRAINRGLSKQMEHGKSETSDFAMSRKGRMVWLWTRFENINLVLDEMTSFIAELFTSTNNIQMGYCAEFVRKKTKWKKFQWCTFHLKPAAIIGICLVLIHRGGSTASKGKHTQCNKCCVKLVLKLCDLSAYKYINIWK